MTHYFTSESVTCGHPDKVCDQIADRILDDVLSQDPSAHVACEVTCATDQVHIFGEVSTYAQVDYADAARQVISKIGYTEPGCGFDADSCKITVDLHEQSPDIARGVCRKTREEDLDVAVSLAEEEFKNAQDLLLSLQEKDKEFSAKAVEWKNKGKENTEKLQAKKDEFARVQTRLESVKNIAERYEGYGNSTRKIMEQKGKIDGIEGVVSDLIHVEKNVSNASYEIPSLTQREKPFVMTHIYYDDISYIKTYISPGSGEIEKDLGSFSPIGTEKSKDDVIKELQGDSVHKVLGPRSFQNVDNVAPGSSYGTFKGSAISTSIDGLPEYYDKLVE